MDTTTLHPQQACLDGMADVQTPARADVLPMVYVLGTLAMPARVITTGSGAVRIEALLDQHVHGHPAALPVLAVHTVPDQGCMATTLELAHQRAARLPAGGTCLARGWGCTVVKHYGDQVMRLIRCDDLSAVPPGAL